MKVSLIKIERGHGNNLLYGLNYKVYEQIEFARLRKTLQMLLLLRASISCELNLLNAPFEVLVSVSTKNLVNERSTSKLGKLI